MYEHINSICNNSKFSFLYRFVNALNRQHLSYKLKLNKFADMTDKEVDRYKGLLNEPEETYNGGKKLHVPDIDFSSTPIPEMLDWREYGKKFIDIIMNLVRT